MLAGDEETLRVMFREHIEREHSFADAPPEERLKAMVSSAVYGFEYVPADAHDGRESSLRSCGPRHGAPSSTANCRARSTPSTCSAPLDSRAWSTP
jgi:hypothetical protein